MQSETNNVDLKQAKWKQIAQLEKKKYENIERETKSEKKAIRNDLNVWFVSTDLLVHGEHQALRTSIFESGWK